MTLTSVIQVAPARMTGVLLTLLILVIIALLRWQNWINDITVATSSIDGQEYLVRDLPDKDLAADNIALIKAKLRKLVNYLTEKYPDNKNVVFLKENYRDSTLLSEAPLDYRTTTYTLNKGDSVHFCLRQRDTKNQLVDLNTITFVALHELAHMMTFSIGHGSDFWENFKFILKHAMELSLYTYQDFHKKPVEYCGTMISDTPLKL